MVDKMAADGESITYKYKPLSRSGKDRKVGMVPIRLLSLHPTLSGASLIGSIDERAEGQHYEALSHCWGKPARLDKGEGDQISIVENDQYSLLPIRGNLGAALRRLRNKTGSYRRLWIDAICIDQDNNAEKSEQIPLMDRIFQEADRVCIWLGDETGKQDSIAREHIAKIIELQGFENFIHVDHTDKWAALASLMRREW
jgi:hypothetical protein